MADKVEGDFETASVANLRDVGLYRYAEHPTTRIWMLSYRFNREPVQRWHPSQPAPNRLLAHVAAGGVFGAHNAAFERRMWNGVLRRLPGCEMWPELQIEQMDCTMCRSLAIHLPADLDDLAGVLRLTERKDVEGKKLMLKMSRPRKVHASGQIEWWDSPENIARLGDYCDQDVRTEAGIDERLPPLSPEELALYRLDQRINDRGVMIDLPLVEKICKVLEVAKRRDNERMARLTAGAVMKTTENAKLLQWFQGRGIQTDSIAKDSHAEIRETIDVFGDDEAEAVLNLRASGAKTSTAKYGKMLQYALENWRACGMFGWHRASTGRWGGSGIQVQNLVRIDEEKELPDVLALIEMLEGAVT